jgi:hypothetical protein
MAIMDRLGSILNALLGAAAIAYALDRFIRWYRSRLRAERAAELAEARRVFDREQERLKILAAQQQHREISQLVNDFIQKTTPEKLPGEIAYNRFFTNIRDLPFGSFREQTPQTQNTWAAVEQAVKDSIKQ